MSDDHIDWKEQSIKVGTTVKYGTLDDGSDCVGTVSKITDPDGDVDDDTGRSILIPPRVYIKYDDGSEDSAEGVMIHQVWTSEYDADCTWQFEELEVVREDGTPLYQGGVCQ